MTAAEIATEAARLVGGQRAAQHGEAHVNHRNIAALWNAYLGAQFGTLSRANLNAADVARMMALLKIARQLTGGHNLDDYIDAAGYIAISGALAQRDADIADAITRENPEQT